MDVINCFLMEQWFHYIHGGLIRQVPLYFLCSEIRSRRIKEQCKVLGFLAHHKDSDAETMERYLVCVLCYTDNFQPKIKSIQMISLAEKYLNSSYMKWYFHFTCHMTCTCCTYSVHPSLSQSILTQRFGRGTSKVPSSSAKGKRKGSSSLL